MLKKKKSPKTFWNDATYFRQGISDSSEGVWHLPPCSGAVLLWFQHLDSSPPIWSDTWPARHRTNRITRSIRTPLLPLLKMNPYKWFKLVRWHAEGPCAVKNRPGGCLSMKKQIFHNVLRLLGNKTFIYAAHGTAHFACIGVAADMRFWINFLQRC